MVRVAPPQIPQQKNPTAKFPIPSPTCRVFPHLLMLLGKTCILCGHTAYDLGYFLTAIWLPHDQLWAIIEGTASVNQC